MKRVAIALLGAVMLSSNVGAGSHVNAATNNGWVKQNSNWYYYVSSAKETGWLQVGGKWYYFNQYGVMQTGWLKYKSSWYYLSASGAMQTGWLQDAGKWYYFEKDGKMKTGWVKTNNKWYYLGKSGSMQTGWIVDKEKRYYLNQSGVMQTGWLEVGGKKYLLNPSGDAIIGWFYENYDNKKAYYFNPDGSMQTGWFTDSDYSHFRYYFSESGTALTGWQEIDGQAYFFTPVMVQNNFVEYRYLNSDGVLTEAGSDTIVAAAEELKKKIDVDMTQEELINILGSNYQEVFDQYSDKYDHYWEYELKITGQNELTAVKSEYPAYFYGVENMSRGLSDIHVIVYWDDNNQSFYVQFKYFDAEHKCHRDTSMKLDNEYKRFEDIYYGFDDGNAGT